MSAVVGLAGAGRQGPCAGQVWHAGPQLRRARHHDAAHVHGPEASHHRCQGRQHQRSPAGVCRAPCHNGGAASLTEQTRHAISCSIRARVPSVARSSEAHARASCSCPLRGSFVGVGGKFAPNQKRRAHRNRGPLSRGHRPVQRPGDPTGGAARATPRSARACGAVLRCRGCNPRVHRRGRCSPSGS